MTKPAARDASRAAWAGQPLQEFTHRVLAGLARNVLKAACGLPPQKKIRSQPRCYNFSSPGA